MRADDHGLPRLPIERGRTLMDGDGRWPRGLQNRLRGAAEASWVGSIPIHPRQISWRRQPVGCTNYVGRPQQSESSRMNNRAPQTGARVTRYWCSSGVSSDRIRTVYLSRTASQPLS